MLCLEQCTRLTSRKLQYFLFVFGAAKSARSREYPPRLFHLVQFAKRSCFKLLHWWTQVLLWNTITTFQWLHCKSLRDPIRDEQTRDAWADWTYYAQFSFCPYAHLVTIYIYRDATSLLFKIKLLNAFAAIIAYCALQSEFSNPWLFAPINSSPAQYKKSKL